MVSAVWQVARVSVVTVTADIRIFIIINVDLTGDQVNQFVDAITECISVQIVEGGE